MVRQQEPGAHQEPGPRVRLAGSRARADHAHGAAHPGALCEEPHRQVVRAAYLPVENFRVCVSRLPPTWMRRHKLMSLVGLDYHCTQFPNTFICSMEQYKVLLGERIAPHAVDKYSARDFAILNFQESTDSHTSYFADLTAGTLSLGPVQEELAVREVDCSATVKLFETFSSLQPGQLFEQPQVLKWKPNHWRDKDWPVHLTTSVRASMGLHAAGVRHPGPTMNYWLSATSAGVDGAFHGPPAHRLG